MMCKALPAGWRPPEGRLALLLRTPLRPRRVHVAPGPTGKAYETATVHLHAQAPLAVGTVERTESPQHMAAFTDDGAAGSQVGLGQRQIFTRCVTVGAHGFASSRMALRSGRKMSGTLPTSPWRFLAIMRSTARAGGNDCRSGASTRNSTVSAAYSRSPDSLSESRAAEPLPLP